MEDENMKFPKELKAGDTVGLICGSSCVDTARIPQCVKAMEDLGYRVKTADNLDVDYGGIMAGSGKVRADWINRMFADPEVNAIFCVRGGDGSSRTMEYLDYDVIRSNPKIFVGYSDVTNLHLGITQNCGFVTFHGPMVSSNIVDSFDEETRNSLYSMINAAEGTVEFRNPAKDEIRVLKNGKASGILTGGNLSLLSASIGTPYEMETEGRILFIEEVCEPVAKIEKWAMHLRNAGLLKKSAGIILGQFTDITNEKCPQYDSIACLTDIFADLDVPVLYNVQSGHGSQIMTLPMGAMCHMDTETRTIRFDVERQG